jgi:hypothetical protein
MAKQLLIYETAVPLSAARHKEFSVETGADYGFSDKINSVPLMAVEFPEAAAEYPIVFAGEGGQVMPALILGMREENLYLSDGHHWKSRYVPAFVRRYPFVFSEANEGQRLVLCIDEAFAGVNRDGRGERLFEDDGKPSQYVQRVLDFLQEYQSQFRRTQAFGKKVSELGLLEPMQAQVDLTSGERLLLSGFMAVNRAKLKALPGEKLAELAKTDELELLYLHLQSMRNFAVLRDRLAESAKAKADETAAAVPKGSGNGAAHSPAV